MVQLYVCSSVHVWAYTCTHTCMLAVHFSFEGNCKQVALSTELTPFSLMMFKYFSSEFKPLHILHSWQSKRNTAVQMPGVLYHSMATSMEPTAEHHRRCKMLWCPRFSVCNRQTEHRESKQLHCILLMHKGSEENEKHTYIHNSQIVWQLYQSAQMHAIPGLATHSLLSQHLHAFSVFHQRPSY